MRDVVGRLARIVLRPRSDRHGDAGRCERFLLQCTDIGRVLARLHSVERGRRTTGPLPLISTLRARGRTSPRRTPSQAKSLERAIAWIDALCPGGRNCYRRALLAIALDPDAAEKPLVIGLHAASERPSGHAWIAGEAEPSERFDVRIELGVLAREPGRPKALTGTGAGTCARPRETARSARTTSGSG